MTNHSHHGSKPESTTDKPLLVSNSNLPTRPKAARGNRKRVSASPQTESKHGFYRAFEERYRGPRDLIKLRLSVYLPFVEPLKQIYPECTALDLGCGRGEWLELLQENGFQVLGVDLDDGMLAACTELGIPAIRQEAIEYLKSLDDASQCIISGFHFAEHISFDNLQLLVAEVLRILKPGGLLILETPNPENVVVGTTNFYLDPTHQRPIPPLLLSFLAEYQGYKRVKVLRLQESSDLAVRGCIELKHVFYEVSPDYAIVAQKNADSKILLRFSTAFDKQYGIELGDLANRYDARIEHRFVVLDQRVGNVESSAGGMVEALSRISALQDRLIEATSQIERNQSRATQLAEQLHHAEARAQEQERRAVAAENRAEEQQKRIDELGGNLHCWWLQATAAETREQALRQSLSWRVTAPLRFGLDAIYVLTGRKKLPSLPQISLRRLVITALGKPRLVAGVHRSLRPFPQLYAYVTRKVTRIAQTPDQHVVSSAALQSYLTGADVDGTVDHSRLTPSARRIYSELRAAIRKHGEANAYRY